ncbi:MAG TPA: Rrf2 family transcriptional regulator [Bacteroidales bacterium]|nr:Rrf2 family transcriptional regulator [Bacteroidales bacterium]HRZ48620.1 Rrf2 family transcriptional regulator [Bacteroidales bacterium]
MLSKKAQYALYALVHLARTYDHGPVLIKDIAEAEKLPRKFLETILLELRTQGILASKKGKGGGYMLRRDPSDVNMAEIIRLFDGAIALLPCATYRYYEQCAHCKDESRCAIKSYVKDVRDETVKMMKGISLKDILERENWLLSHPSETI